MPSAEAARTVASRRWRDGGVEPANRAVAEEAPVAIVHDGSTTAVLMATPANLEDLAIGFTLTEGIVDDLGQIEAVETVAVDNGVEARVWLTREQGARLAARRRYMAGPTGCGLCGVDSLAEAVRRLPVVTLETRIAADEILRAMEAMSQAQALGQATRAAHAAAFWRAGELVGVREDVGRHNALDKLVGDLATRSVDSDGVILLTSRVSVEMVQKAAVFGGPILCAVSAPTSLAIETAQIAGVTLVAICRADGFEVFTHPDRVELA